MEHWQIALLILSVGIPGVNFYFLWRVVFNHIAHLRKLIEAHIVDHAKGSFN